MSIISSRVSSISSILKAPGSRATIVGLQKKITFKLPTNLKDILIEEGNNKNRSKFEDLKNLIQHSQIKDEDFLILLRDIRECLPVLKPVHRSFIEILFNIEWRTRSAEVISLYKKFVDDLIDMHPQYYKLVVDKLIAKLKPGENEKEWDGPQCPKEEQEKINHIHDIFKTFLKIRPMSTEIIVSSLVSAFPHWSVRSHVMKCYVLVLLQIVEYAPLLRRDILCLVIQRLTTLDVNVSLSKIQYCEDVEQMDEDISPYDAIDSEESGMTEENKNEIEMMKNLIRTLDTCMEEMFVFIERICYEDGKLNMDNLKSLFHDLIYCFDKIILPTHASYHIQFIMFYICSFKTSVMDAFVRFLWLKVSDPNAPPVIRQYAVSYISSLLARSKTTPLSFLQNMISEMSNWIHGYIQQDSSQNVNTDVHLVFYSICQALFYLIAFRHKELTDGKKNLLFLQSLQLTKIVSCKLNPLKVCQTAVLQNFAAVTRNYQLAYCYTIIERNSRTVLPVLNCNMDTLKSFFPFDPYLLKISAHRIINTYYVCQKTTAAISEPIKINLSNNTNDGEEDDFMEESFSQEYEVSDSFDKFSYGSSPGFCKNTFK